MNVSAAGAGRVLGALICPHRVRPLLPPSVRPSVGLYNRLLTIDLIRPSGRPGGRALNAGDQLLSAPGGTRSQLYSIASRSSRRPAHHNR